MAKYRVFLSMNNIKGGEVMDKLNKFFLVIIIILIVVFGSIIIHEYVTFRESDKATLDGMKETSERLTKIYEKLQELEEKVDTISDTNS